MNQAVFIEIAGAAWEANQGGQADFRDCYGSDRTEWQQMTYRVLQAAGVNLAFTIEEIY